MPSIFMEIEFMSTNGANYLAASDPLIIEAETLTNTKGLQLVPGDVITQIGDNKRGMVTWPASSKITYLGTYMHDDVKHAIFAPANNAIHNGRYFYYAYTVVLIDGKLKCLLVFTPQGNGCYDIETNYIEKI